jgi:hypothetical protein
LDAWLGKVVGAGFFAFSMEGRDRLISSWFVAAVPHSVLLGAWADITGTYLQEHGHKFKEYLMVVRSSFWGTGCCTRGVDCC